MTLLHSALSLAREIQGVSHDDALHWLRDALEQQGFGILFEIDLKAKLKDKVGRDIMPYTIVGACLPQVAYDAIVADDAVGLLLPCNLVVHEPVPGQVIVSAVNPDELFKLIGTQQMKGAATEVRDRLVAVVDGVGRAVV